MKAVRSILSTYSNEFAGLSGTRRTAGRAKHEIDVFQRAAEKYAERALPSKTAHRFNCESCGFDVRYPWNGGGHRADCLAAEVVRLLAQNTKSPHPFRDEG